jgi:hypothetical protein
MTPNTMRAANSCIVRRIPPTWVPAGQAVLEISTTVIKASCIHLPMPRTERQLHIRLRPTTLNLTTRWRLSRAPRDTFTRRIRRRNLQRAPGEPVTKHVAHVVPHLTRIETVCKNGLTNIRFEEAAFNGADLQCDATRRRVSVKDLAVGSVFCDDFLLADAAADRPEVDWLVALVRHDCATDSLGAERKAQGSECQCAEMHDEASDEANVRCTESKTRIFTEYCSALSKRKPRHYAHQAYSLIYRSDDR